MLGPEGQLYNPLPSPTSIRILYLAPGKSEDEIFCFIYPCDLDRDRTIDPSIPRPFESLCVAIASGLNNGDETKRFTLPLDSYIEENQGDPPQVPKLEAGKAPQLKDFDPATSSQHQDEEIQEDATSQVHEHIIKPSNLDKTSQDKNNPPQTDASDEQPGKELDDDMWDLRQLMRLVRADGALDSSVRRHPFQRYMALSYVWGSTEAPACITIDGVTKFRVTRNLFNALKCLRRKDTARALWIDAICINQKDPEEKKVQIGLMRRVYRQAQRVIAYVPQTREDTKDFGMLVNKILKAESECQKVIKSGATKSQQELAEESEKNNQAEDEDQNQIDASASDSRDGGIRHIPLKPTGTCIEDYDIPAEDDPAWGAWRRFFASPFFRRIWILQEYALAREIYFDFGGPQYKADFLMVVMNSVEDRSRLLNANYLGRGENPELTKAASLGWMGLKQMILERVVTRYDVYGSKKIENLRLIDKLEKSMYFDATDPRDKIYALLGLVSDAEQFTDLVSYESSETYLIVYRRFAKALIEKGCLLQVLNMACHTPSSKQLPSWVPDWSAPTSQSMVATLPRENRFQAGGKAVPISFHFSLQHQDQLVISGRIFSTIVFKSSTFKPRSTNAPFATGIGRLQDLFENLLVAMNEVSVHLAQAPTATLLDIFHILTLQEHRLGSLKPQDSGFGEMMNDWLLFRTFMARAVQYSQIENASEHKVVFGAMPEEDRDFIQKLFRNTSGRSFCVAEDEKRIGLVSEQAQVGDSIAIIDGAPIPFVLREMTNSVAGEKETYSIIGDTYITGVMQGELLQKYGNAGEEIILV